MRFHPYAMTFPPLEGQAYEDFKRDIAEHGQREAVKYRMVKGEKQGLDGRNRLRACEDLCVPCLDEHHETPDDQVEAYIDSLNAHRRHLTPDQQAERRKGRVERVAKAREKGESIRQIAEKEGVSRSQVQRDLGDAGVPPGTPDEEDLSGEQGCSPEPTPAKKVIGKDGKTYPARKPKAATNGTAESLKAAADAADDEEPEDEGEQTIEQQIKAKNSELESWCRGLMDYAKTMPEDPWLDYMNRREGALEKLRNCAEAVRAAKCLCPCPKCEGNGCSTCQKSGRVTKYMLDQIG